MRPQNTRQRLWLSSLAILVLVGLPVPDLSAQQFKPAVKLAAGYKLVWNDEFDGAELNLDKWKYRQLGKREHTTVSKESISLDGKGHLSLATRQRGDELLVGMIGTQETFRRRYGYFECRLKFQKLQGHHGAFWLQSPNYGKFVDDPGKSGAEIDVIEFFGSGRSDHGAGITVHWNPYPNTTKVSEKPKLTAVLRTKRGRTAPELCDDYHIYGLLWTDREYVVSIDGREMFRTSEGLSHVEQFIVLSLLSSDWERPYRNRTNPTTAFQYGVQKQPFFSGDIHVVDDKPDCDYSDQSTDDLWEPFHCTSTRATLTISFPATRCF